MTHSTINQLVRIRLNEMFQSEVGGRVGAYSDQALIEVSQFDSTNFSSDVNRQLSLVGSQSLSKEEMNELYSIQNQMGNIYASYQVRTVKYVLKGLLTMSSYDLLGLQETSDDR